MSQVDETFRAQRAQLRDTTVAQATAIWHATYEDRNRFLGKVLTLVDGADRAMVTLVSAYMTAKARELGHVPFKGLKLDEYTVAKLRGTTGPDVYGKVYAALYGQMIAGASDEEAHAAAVDALSKLAATDVHLAYTTAARDWMHEDPSVGAFKRVPSGTCDYCESAAGGLYRPSVVMPIHENCECDVEPVFGTASAAAAATGLAFHTGDAGAVAEDTGAGDINSRLDTTGAVPASPKRRRRR